jgi:hypothetical protein
MTTIPENYTDFFYWLKERTEAFWSTKKNISTTGIDGEDWFYGAKWTGLAENKIDEIELKYSIQLMPEHREFLKILHTIDRKEEIKYTETVDGKDEIKIEKRSFFYNWLEDENDIITKFKWPFETLLADVIGRNSVWLKSWGPVANSDEEKKIIFSKWYNEAPKLIPIKSHRFLVSELHLKDRPVLSIIGSDIIVYGWNFRYYLLNELEEYLDMNDAVYDKEDQYYYSPELKKINETEWNDSRTKDIPYWKEMILLQSSGWSSFGLQYPGPDQSSIQP